MSRDIQVISLPLPFRMGSVNCYLVRMPAGQVLIDTGSPNARKQLLRALAAAGCRPGVLRLVILTHGDFDHIGNAACVAAAFGARLAMHRDDAGMAERGDMFVNRKRPNALVRTLMPLFTGFREADRFTPDVLLAPGNDLSQYGLAADVISLPGHSRGSIGILTADGDLFCGDLFDNTKLPALNALMDDPAAARASVASLRGLQVRTVYPGHGPPFAGELLPVGASPAS